MKIRKFNEAMEDGVDISNERVSEIITDIKSVSESIEDNHNSINELYMELSKFKSKSSKNNDQIDDSVINLELLRSKLNESVEVISKINELLESYNMDGRKYLY